jgi:hypothetical protein
MRLAKAPGSSIGQRTKAMSTTLSSMKPGRSRIGASRNCNSTPGRVARKRATDVCNTPE